MSAEELVRFLSVLRTFVSTFWQSRIDEIIKKIQKPR